MNNSGKSEEEFINEIEELRNENDRLRRSLLELGIADLKMEEVEFQRTEDLHKTIILTAMDGFWLVDNEGGLLEVNEAYCRMSGYANSELTSMRITDLEALETADKWANHLQKIIFLGDDRFETRHRRKDGTLFDVEISVMYRKFEEGRFIVFLRDITENKRSEIALYQSERKYRSLVETAQELIWKCDLKGRFTYLNPAWENTHGYKVDEMLGKSFSQFVSPEVFEKDKLEFARQLRGGSVKEYETNHLTKDGREITLLFNAIPLIDQQGNLIGTQGTAIDITRRKLAEKALITAKEQAQESDRLKSAFLANMSHEIRTPMNGILGFAGLLKETKLSGKEQQEYIQIIENSGVRMLNIINDIIDISKIESGQTKVDFQESNVNQLIEYIYSFFKADADARGLQLSIKNSLPSKESVINTDREKVYAILTNLVKNAIKFSDKGSIEFGYLKKGSNLEFFVRDTGIGIAPERQLVIFERFMQADISDKRAFQGAGLGLAISKAYIEMLGGKIWVESTMGEGSTFYFTLPYNARPLEKITSGEVGAAVETEALNKKLKILIAEDDEISEKLITILVNPFRKEVLIANSGIEAVEKCRNNPDIDLVFMDIQMPGLNGYEATRQIRQFNKDVIIIAQTAFGLIGDREKAIEAGCNDYIAKPLDRNLLKKLIRDYFKMARS